MDHVLVRYSELGTKSRPVVRRMRARLRDRVAERLAFEGFDGVDVETTPGRVIAVVDAAGAAAPAIAELPGVASASPVTRVPVDREAIESATDEFDIVSPFAVRVNTAGDQPWTSEELERDLGAHVQERTGAAVNLEDPATTVEVDVREEGAFVFIERFEGPGGFPVGSQASLAALISGGIDSPVAAHETMTRGSDIVPIYFYNRPMAAGDHIVRFEATLAKLARMHPAKDWYYHLVDMAAVNERLADVDTGRMLLHRRVMFRAAEVVAEDEGCAGIVTGESIGQKSSQTAANLALTSAAIGLPIHRPLLTVPKQEIVQRARALGTYEEAVVDSACRTIAPAHPSASLGQAKLDALERQVDIDALVEEAAGGIEIVDL